MKPLVSWLLLVLAAWSLLPPNLEPLLAAWLLALALWVIAERAYLPVILWTAVSVAALTIPSPLPSSWAPLLQLGLMALLWSLVLGIALRLLLRRQTEAGSH